MLIGCKAITPDEVLGKGRSRVHAEHAGHEAEAFPWI
jgi:hypothetical protein